MKMIILSIIVTITASIVPSSVFATDSLLIQEIQLIDCTATHVQDGITQRTPTECQGAIAPMVNYQETQDTTPTLTGSFDAERASTLEVRILNRIYKLGVNPELVAAGNYWTLTLEKTPPLAPGTYNVIVEVVTKDGLFLRDGSKRDLVILSTPGDDSGALPATGESIFIIIGIGLLLICAGSVVLWRYYRP